MKILRRISLLSLNATAAAAGFAQFAIELSIFGLMGGVGFSLIGIGYIMENRRKRDG